MSHAEYGTAEAVPFVEIWGHPHAARTIETSATARI
jgi:hypothetical protein